MNIFRRMFASEEKFEARFAYWRDRSRDFERRLYDMTAELEETREECIKLHRENIVLKQILDKVHSKSLAC